MSRSRNRWSTRSATSSCCRTTASCTFPVVDYRTMQRGYFADDVHAMQRRGLADDVPGDDPSPVLPPGLPRAVDPGLAGPRPGQPRRLPGLQLPALSPGVGPVPHGLRHAPPVRLPAPRDAPPLPAGDRVSPTTGDGSTSTGKISWSGFSSIRSCSGSSGGRSRRRWRLATTTVFLATWLLHAYQSYWLRGSWGFTVPDALFWGILGVLVLVNVQLDARRSRTRGSRPPRRRRRPTPRAGPACRQDRRHVHHRSPCSGRCGRAPASSAWLDMRPAEESMDHEASDEPAVARHDS